MAEINVFGFNSQPMDISSRSKQGSLLMPYEKSIEALDLPDFSGTQSMFNPYVIFALYDIGQNSAGEYQYTYHYDMYSTVKAQDNPEQNTGTGVSITRTQEEILKGAAQQYGSIVPVSVGSSNGGENSRGMKIAPTAKNIIEYNQNVKKVFGYGPTPYSWSDFLYCKYYGKIPNTHMVTLRRYPYPISDNVVVPNANAVVPVAQAVTWFGEDTGNKLSEILKMTYGVIWKEVEATVQEVDGNEQAFGSGIESLAGSKAVSAMGAVLTASRGSYDLWSGRTEKGVEWAKKAYTNDGPYWNQIYGPVNVVHKSHMRDRGVKFQSDVTLNFHYSLRSINGVNPKVAMLDLITNFLLLTYTNAKFWGGATRYFPNATFRVGFLGDQSKFYSGDYTGYAKSIGTQISATMSDLADGLTKILSGDFSSLIKTIANLTLGNMSEKSMPNALSIRSMLSGDPVGEWHLTVGNPLNPIAVIGNLIMEETTIEFGETLGVDDFPTEVKFTVKLKPGKPRDKGDIESMFNNGYGRMSYAPLTTLPSSKNTFGTAADNPDTSTPKTAADIAKAYEESQEKMSKLYDELKGSTDTAITTIKKRVTEMWGPTFGDSANLLFMINATKSRF